MVEPLTIVKDFATPMPPKLEQPAGLHQAFAGNHRNSFSGPRDEPSEVFAGVLLVTIFHRCWHILLFFAAWSTGLTLLNHHEYDLHFAPTLLTVIGTVLGFVISYRTSSAYVNYNEGRRLWSQIILSSRTMARLIWFHVPDPAPLPGQTEQDAAAHGLIERKTAINMIDAFAVAVKHYLRGEDGIYYRDLYYLVKFLPTYALPAGRPGPIRLDDGIFLETDEDPPAPPVVHQEPMRMPASPIRSPTIRLNIPDEETRPPRRMTTNQQLPSPVTASSSRPLRRQATVHSRTSLSSVITFQERDRLVLSQRSEMHLLPGHMPPKSYGLWDALPFSFLFRYLLARWRKERRKDAIKARIRNKSAVSYNLPLEISLYLGSYVASLQKRKIIEHPTTNSLLAAVQQMVDSLTGLERVLTTPIPFSYSFHLWAVTVVYCLALPAQIWPTLGWVTIPATVLLTFIFFGFLVAGEEIENPFGYDKNDLNLDHFTNNIIRNELRALTSTPPPDPTRWAFHEENNLLFSRDSDERIPPNEWVVRGPEAIKLRLNTL